MRCLPKETLSAYLDGELGEECTTHVQRHLKRCPQCQSVVRELERVARVLATLPLPVLPRDMRCQVVEQLSNQRSPKGYIKVLPWAGVVAAILLAITVMWGINQTGYRDDLSVYWQEHERYDQMTESDSTQDSLALFLGVW